MYILSNWDIFFKFLLPSWNTELYLWPCVSTTYLSHHIISCHIIADHQINFIKYRQKKLENWFKLIVSQCFIVKVSICWGFFFVSPIRTGALIFTYMRHYFFRWEDNVFDNLFDSFYKWLFDQTFLQNDKWS